MDFKERTKPWCTSVQVTVFQAGKHNRVVSLAHGWVSGTVQCSAVQEVRLLTCIIHWHWDASLSGTPHDVPFECNSQPRLSATPLKCRPSKFSINRAFWLLEEPIYSKVRNGMAESMARKSCRLDVESLWIRSPFLSGIFITFRGDVDFDGQNPEKNPTTTHYT